MTLQPSRLKMLALLGSLIFVAGGVAMLKIRPAGMDSGEALMMWLAVGFFGLCAAVFAVLLLPGAASLTLAADGFEVCNRYRRTRFPWADTRNFRVQQFSDAEAHRRQVVRGYAARHLPALEGRLLHADAAVARQGAGAEAVRPATRQGVGFRGVAGSPHHKASTFRSQGEPIGATVIEEACAAPEWWGGAA